MTTASDDTPVPRSIDTSAVARAVHGAIPGSRVLSIEAIDSGVEDDSTDPVVRLVRYGEPLLIRVLIGENDVRELLFHSASSGASPSQHRAERAAAMLLAYDSFRRLPRHAEAFDVGAVSIDGGELLTLREAGEFYLLTEFVPGHSYADELRVVAQRGELGVDDLERASELALGLSELHTRVPDRAGYRRSVRDLLGGAEGIFGTIDAFADNVPAASPATLERLERLCMPWRWKLRDYEHRASRIHGDFHLFNIVFSDGGVRLLEARRGCVGEPADDVVCLTINHVFFGLMWPGTWKPCFRRLWNASWNAYLTETSDHELLEVAAPYFAWRALMLANPEWYPSTPASVRERLFVLVEQVLGSARFDLGSVEMLFRDEEPHSSTRSGQRAEP